MGEVPQAAAVKAETRIPRRCLSARATSGASAQARTNSRPDKCDTRPPKSRERRHVEPRGPALRRRAPPLRRLRNQSPDKRRRARVVSPPRARAHARHKSEPHQLRPPPARVRPVSTPRAAEAARCRADARGAAVPGARPAGEEWMRGSARAAARLPAGKFNSRPRRERTARSAPVCPRRRRPRGAIATARPTDRERSEETR